MLDYYLSTYCGGLFFALTYHCRRYSCGFILVLAKCNPDLKLNGSITILLKPLGYILVPTSSFGFGLPKLLLQKKKKTKEKIPQQMTTTFILKPEAQVEE